MTITNISLPVLTELFVRADKDAGNGDNRLTKKEFERFFSEKTIYSNALKTYERGNIGSLLSDDRFKGDQNAGKRAQIEANFQNAGGFKAIRDAMSALHGDSNMAITLFDYAMGIQKKRAEAQYKESTGLELQINISSLFKTDFDTHNVPNGIGKEETRSGALVTGIQYDSTNPGWIQTVSKPKGLPPSGM